MTLKICHIPSRIKKSSFFSTQNFNHNLISHPMKSNEMRNVPVQKCLTSLICNFIDTEPRDKINPCIDNPCGPNSQCRVIGNQGACSCLPDYIGRPPNCRPQCTSNQECASNKACHNERCVDPCIGKCGENAVCSVVKHNPVCNCISGYEGDPFTRCTIIVVTCKNLIS